MLIKWLHLRSLATSQPYLRSSSISSYTYPLNEQIRSLYTNFQTSIITDKFSTPFITVGHGVLQGDCLSPLLFNMSFNTFVQYIKSESWLQIKSYLIASQYGVNGPVCLYVLTNAPRLALKNTYPSLSNTWLNCLLTKISFLVSKLVNLSATLVIVLISTC